MDNELCESSTYSKLFIGHEHSACGQNMGFADNTAFPMMRNYNPFGLGRAIGYEI